MKNTLKRTMALMIALLLVVTQLAVPVSASETAASEPAASEAASETPSEAAEPAAQTPSEAAVEPQSPPPENTSSGTVDAPVVPGGADQTEEVPVDIVISTDDQGNVNATITTPAEGAVTDSGTTVNLESEVVTDANGNVVSEDTEFDAVTAADEDGTTVTIQGGVESSSEEIYGGDLTADLITDGTVNPDTSVSSDTASATTTGDVQEGASDTEFDQTTTTVTDRTLDVTVTEQTTTSGDSAFVDEDGNLFYVDEDGNRIEEEPIYNGYDWVYSSKANTVGSGTWYAVKYDENGNVISREALKTGSVNEKKATNTETDEQADSLYCTDISTSFIVNGYGYGYRQVNLEDAVEEGFYTVEEAAHLRAIMNNGYTWEDHHKEDSQAEDAQLNEIKAMLTDKLENGTEEEKALLAGMDIENLTKEDAALATGMAVWHYGNRFEMEEGAKLEVELSGGATEANARRMQLYNYLITLSEEADETQIINEEKFIEDMSFTVAEKVDGHVNNQDTDTTNDVYNTSLKFSMVVTPDRNSDDLIVKVFDAQGNVVKQARIAGDQKEGETFGYAKTEIDDSGKTYYVLDNMQLSENENTVFNLKLEGTQLLKEGVYVFESEHYGDEEAWNKFAAIAGFGTGENYRQYKINEATAKLLAESPNATQEEIDAACAKALATELERINNAQSFIGHYSGTAEVDVTAQVNITFNVEEATVTTTHTWRTEESYTPPATQPPVEDEEEAEDGADDEGGVPADQNVIIVDEDVPLGGNPNARMGRRPLLVMDDADEAEADELEILDEDVPLAKAPKTGDVSLLWAAFSGLTFSGMFLVNKKREDEEA